MDVVRDQPDPDLLPVSRLDRLVAVGYGIACHTAFAAAVALAVTGILTGLQTGRGRLPAPAAWVANAALIVQFPLLHSFLLTRPGARVLARLAPRGLGTPLATTSFAALAALQFGGVFLLWTPSGRVWWEAAGGARVLLTGLHGGAWLLLARSMWEAGAPAQTGWLGWSAVARGRAPRFGPLPRSGLFARCRHPVYLSFALILWTTPTWTPDQLALSASFTAYCLLGPLLKERRYLRRHGEEYRRYRRQVPYILPWPRRRAPEGVTA